MDIILGITLISLLTTVSIVIFINYKKRKRLELAARIAKEEYNKTLQSFEREVEEAMREYNYLMNQNIYISNFSIYLYTSKYLSLLNKIPYDRLESLAYEGKLKELLKLFKSSLNSIEHSVKRKNENFIQSELIEYDAFFSDIEDNSLDLQQRKAIIINEDNNIVIAGAGSGKTTTIVGKVKYLLSKYKVSPNEILLISFTKKASEEMRKRIKKRMNIDISVKTFHKLGLDIIAEISDEKPSVFDLSQKQILELFASFIQNAKKNKSYYDRLIHFITFWLKPYKPENEFDSEGERTNYLIDLNYEGLKLIRKQTSNGVITYREKLKSQEEVLIANFLFINNIKYTYEDHYVYKTASKKFGQYKPDFYLPGYGIYLEHFAIDKNGNVPDWFKGDEYQNAKEKYNAGIAWKRELHKSKNTQLIETYSWEKREGILLSNLEKKLKAKNVEFNPMSNDELWNYIKTNIPADIDNFTVLLYTFLVLMKSNNITVNELFAKAQDSKDERALLFLELFEPIKSSYDNYLQEENEIDFSDMINNATALIKSCFYKSPYKYIIIDEFQDISFSRYQLIKTLLDIRPETKLFCVGDDWQSIYRFTGSDIGIFIQFSDYFKTSSLDKFNRKTEKSFIEYTYRFDNQLIDASGSFILKNPNQISKELKSHKQSSEKPITVLNYTYNNSIVEPLMQAIEAIQSKVNGANTSILLLGRYTHDINEIKEKSKLSFVFDKVSQTTLITYPPYPNITFDFLTVHSAKGLEADFIVILNGNAGKYGFPTEISDDPLLNFLLSKSDQFPNGEERRVFYVAMTRARKQVFILSNKDNRSKFLDEIETDVKVIGKKCEWCDNGTLLERHGPYGYFYACSSIHYCNFTRKIVPADFIEKAEILHEEKDFQQAIIYYSKALEIDGNNYETYFNRGRCYEESGMKDDALSDYSSAISSNKSHSESYYWRASVNYDLSNFQEAANDWNQSIKLNYNIDSSLYWYAKSLLNLKLYPKALEIINKFITNKPSDKEGYVLRGECYALMKDPVNAKLDWIKAQNLGQENINYFFKKYGLPIG